MVSASEVRSIKVKVVDKETLSPIKGVVIYYLLETVGVNKILGFIPALGGSLFRYRVIEEYNTGLTNTRIRQNIDFTILVAYYCDSLFNDFMKSIFHLSLVFLLIVFVGCNNAKDQSSQNPNIILIMADDMGYECLSCNGSTSYQTPVLDKLAEGGIRFTHCISQPLCTPSRVKIMTGQYNFRNYGNGYC